MSKKIDQIRKMLATAGDPASTPGEAETAMQMAMKLMDKFGLEREDIEKNDDGSYDLDTVDQINMYREEVKVLTKRIPLWNKMLAMFVTMQGIRTTSCYLLKRNGSVMFYGPEADVKAAAALFSGLMGDIARDARNRFGGFYKGSGASFCEGFVSGLTQKYEVEAIKLESQVENTALIVQQDALIVAVKDRAKDWLSEEFNVNLKSGGRSPNRRNFDQGAYNTGKAVGGSHDAFSSSRKRLA